MFTQWDEEGYWEQIPAQNKGSIHIVTTLRRQDLPPLHSESPAHHIYASGTESSVWLSSLLGVGDVTKEAPQL